VWGKLSVWYWQTLLNEGAVSPRHDALVMDGSRSVLGCALSHLRIFERVAAGGGGGVGEGTSAGDVESDDGVGGWTLVLEDDFLLPPHFLTLLAHAWAALPRQRPRTSAEEDDTTENPDKAEAGADSDEEAEADLVYLGAGSNRRGPLEWINRRVFRPAQTVRACSLLSLLASILIQLCPRCHRSEGILWMHHRNSTKLSSARDPFVIRFREINVPISC
jgi:hypothetical protein